ncbi:MAG: DUF2163 domain-containing protein [Pseudomonadota bacterium]
MRVFFDRNLDTVATFWRVFRKDGVTLGFISHDRDLSFAGIRYRTAPGMVPSAIRMTNEVSDDSAEVEGALSHDAISASDLANGLYDEAAIEIGAVDWESLEHATLYSGKIGQIEDDTRGFTAQLRSAKHILDQDLVPRSSPTCRALFCGPGCGLSAPRFTSKRTLIEFNEGTNSVRIDVEAGVEAIDGQVRMLAGPQTGLVFGVIDASNGWLTLDRPFSKSNEIGFPLELREGCDHTITTCANRFDNARNFRGEPFLPGNDLLARYGRAS